MLLKQYLGIIEGKIRRQPQTTTSYFVGIQIMNLAIQVPYDINTKLFQKILYVNGINIASELPRRTQKWYNGYGTLMYKIYV